MQFRLPTQVQMVMHAALVLYWMQLLLWVLVLGRKKAAPEQLISVKMQMTRMQL